MVDSLDELAGHIADKCTRQREGSLTEAEDKSHQQSLTVGHLGAERRGGGDHQGVDTKS